MRTGAQARWHEQVRPGLLTAEVDAKVAGLIVEEAARRYPPGVELAVFCQTISSPRTWFGTAPSDTIEKGSALVTSITTQINALGAANERTRFYGKPSPRQAKLFECSRAANEAACAAAVVGKSAAQVCRRCAVRHRTSRAGAVLTRLGSSERCPITSATAAHRESWNI